MIKKAHSLNFICILFLTLASFSQLLSTEKPKTTSAVNFDKEKFTQDISIEIKRILKEIGIPSLSISVFKKDEILLNEAWGYMNLKLKKSGHSIWPTTIREDDIDKKPGF